MILGSDFMKRDALAKCPICENDTEITRISCNKCGTNIEGHFQLCKFCKLSEDQKLFLDAFIKSRGNIKEVEKELGISYPTVKNRLEDVATALGYKSNPEILNTNKNIEVLDKLNSGEITVDDAITQIREKI
jgi:hypothetical protein